MQVILILWRFFFERRNCRRLPCSSKKLPDGAANFPRSRLEAKKTRQTIANGPCWLRASGGQRPPRQDRRQGPCAPPAGRRNANSSGWTARPVSIISFARSAAPLICDIGERHRPGTNLQPGKPTRGATQAPRGDLPLRGSTGDEFLGVDAGGIHAETVQRRFRRLDHRRRTAKIYFAIAGIQDLRTQ